MWVETEQRKQTDVDKEEKGQCVCESLMLNRSSVFRNLFSESFCLV